MSYAYRRMCSTYINLQEILQIKNSCSPTGFQSRFLSGCYRIPVGSSFKVSSPLWIVVWGKDNLGTVMKTSRRRYAEHSVPVLLHLTEVLQESLLGTSVERVQWVLGPLERLTVRACGQEAAVWWECTRIVSCSVFSASPSPYLISHVQE